MNVTPNKLKKILDTFGHRCLIILDGLDELPSKSKEQIVKIITGKSMLFCNIFLTSRPHTVAEFENYFHTIARLQGFTATHAHSLVDKIITEKKQRREVRKFTRQHQFLHDSLYTCPILLVFICILAQNNELDTFARNVTTGDIYLKLLRFLFRKYCVRRNIPFREETFREVLKRVGKLAFQCLQTFNYLYKQEEVYNMIGEDAFEYGFISGHEDFRLLGDAAADVFITFPHQIIEEFFGAFHFVFNDYTNSLSTLFMMNIYFLEFCLFAVDCTFTEHKTETNVKGVMMQDVLDVVNVSQLDMSSIAHYFLALSWYLAVLTNNKLVVKFLAEMFSKCSRVKLLMLNVDDVLHGVVKAVQPLFPHLHCVHLTGIRYLASDLDAIPLPELCPGSLNLVVSHQHDVVFNTVFSYLTRLQKDICLFVVIAGLQSELDLSTFLRPEISKLHLLSYGPNNCKVISASINRMYRKLIHLSIKDLFITPNCLLALSNARKSGLLPNLSHILFPNCQYSGDDNIKSLFQSVWSTLTELNLNSCFLSKADNDILSKHRDILPQLTSLELYLGSNIKIEDEDTVPRVCANYMLVESKGDATLSTVLSANLTRLWLHEIDPSFYCDLIECVRRSRLPQLKELGVSTWMKGDKTDPKDPPNKLIGLDLMIIGIFQWIQGSEFPDIKSLTFNRFIRSMDMLHHFSRTPVLTNLQKLDISHSFNISGCLSLLMCHRFPSLEILILGNCVLSNDDLYNLTQASLKNRIPELKHLDISSNNKLDNINESFFSCTAKWQKLSCLIIDRLDEVSDIFNQPCDCLDNLEEIQFKVSGEGIFNADGQVKWQRLTNLKMACSMKGFLKTLAGITHNVECDMLPSLETLCVELTVDMTGFDYEKLLKNLWKMLKKKLRPSICKHVVDSVSQFGNCTLNNRYIHHEYDGNLSDNFSLKTPFNNNIYSILNTMTEPIKPEEKAFLHSTLNDWLFDYCKTEEFLHQTVPSSAQIALYLPAMKQRLRRRNVNVFIYNKTGAPETRSLQHILKIQNQESDQKEI